MLKIVSFFGTPWCSDCKRTKAFLGEHRIPYDWINIDDNEEAALVVEKINDGLKCIEERWPMADADKDTERPVFVFSAGWRSGSTLLQRLL